MTPQDHYEPNPAFARLHRRTSDILEAEELGFTWAILSHLEHIRDEAADLAEELLDQLRQELARERAARYSG